MTPCNGLTLLLVLTIFLFTGGEIRLVESHRQLPDNLRECYPEDGPELFVPKLPLNLQTVLDVVRKLERRMHPNVSIRTLSAALIHRYKLDGISYSGSAASNLGVLRYAATGPQRARNRIVQELVPTSSATKLLLAEAESKVLTRDERCLLHFALSNTIWEHFDNKREESLCRPPPTEKQYQDDVNSYRSQQPSDNRCPKETGVVRTNYGTVALGSIISAIAAGLEPQTVRTSQLTMSMPQENSTSSRMWLERSNSEVDNVWIATVSGELAEVVINQGPIYQEQVYMGASGFWNDTVRPRVFYLHHNNQKNFDLTSAEIIGAIDGLIIGKNLKTFGGNLRLSQVLSSYFSESGIDGEIRACHRSEEYRLLLGGRTSGKLISEQTYAASQVLGYVKSVAVVTDRALERLVTRAVGHFNKYVEGHLLPPNVLCGMQKSGLRLDVEMLLGFDGSWTRDYTAQFFSVLVEDLEVSMYGSRMGILDGQTGNCLLSPTSSPASAHAAINDLSKVQWPTGMNLNNVFKVVLEYLDKHWDERLSRNSGHYTTSGGQAVVLLVAYLRMSEQEYKLALDTLKNIKARHPEVNFLYFTLPSKAESLKPFLVSEEDRIVTTLRIDDIYKSLSTVPVTLRSGGGCLKSSQQIRSYVNPKESVTYRLHPQHSKDVKTVKITGAGYGSARVCSWNQLTANADKLETQCRDIEPNGYVSFGVSSVNTYFQILNVTSLHKCTDIDCKIPDQVKFTISLDNRECSSSSSRENVLVSFFLIIACLAFVKFS